jgi:hypothetical protein
MVNRTPIPQRSNSTLELITGFSDSYVAHLSSADDSMFLSFNEMQRMDVDDFETLFFKRNGEIVTSIHVKQHIATRMEIELARDGVIEP